MATSLNILIVEDSQNDADLIVAELRRAGFAPEWKRVETEPDFLAEINNSPDLILSDYSMPQFSGLRAAQLARESGRDIPFILISGTVGEEVAVEAMKSGVADYLLKDRLVRLGRAAEHALEQKQLRAERKQAETALRESEEKFRQLAENINEVFWITDPAKNRMLYISPAYEKIWGRSCASLYQSPRSWLDAIHPEDRPRIVEAATTKQPRGEYDETYRILRPDGSVRWIHDRAFPIRNPAGEVYRVVGTAEDVTEHRQLEAQFRQSQKMEAIGQLAGGVAHDFNNIRAVIQMRAGLLRAEQNLLPTHTDYAGEIEKAAQHAASLTRQLLMFSRRQTLQPRDLDLNGTIAHMVKMLHRILGEDIHIQLKYAPGPLLIRADAGMMDQILMNLTINSRDAMPKGGQLVIETSTVNFDELAAAQSPPARPGSFACLSVSDNGCGILPDVLPRIFEPFFTTKNAGSGTGLGLATVFGIVQQHQGWINVHSEAGQGTTVLVYLPRLAGPQDKTETPYSQLSSRGGSETILVVEDDSVLRAVVRNALTRLGYQVVEAATGISALEVWNQNHAEIRLLVTDLMMPDGLNGKELALQLSRKNSNLKVIYTSGYRADIAGKDLRLEEGVNFLAKPFQIVKLAQAVRNSLDRAV
jgi:two-component system, cell cycle sensor histidine kinase and response regulator CckA